MNSISDDTELLLEMVKKGKVPSQDELMKLATIDGKVDYAKLVKYGAMAGLLYKKLYADKKDVKKGR